MPKDYHSVALKQFRIPVSIFTRATGTKPKTVMLADVLEDIWSGRYQDQIAQLREQLVIDREVYCREKKKLPAFTISGTAKTRKHPEIHSNLLPVDIDSIGDKLPELRERLKNDSHVAFGFVSPSGHGLKLGVRIDGTQHLASFQATERYFLERYAVEIDPACKDVLRLCFVSHDPDLWINNNAVILPVAEKETDPHNSSESCVLNGCVSASLNTYISTSLHHTPDKILANITGKVEARRLFEAKHPNLAKLYTRFIESHFQARAHGRNDFIVKSTPFLFRAVGARFVLLLVGHFYDCNLGLFNDSRDQHMKEAKCMFESVIETYAKSLSPVEREIYAALAETEQDAFRICRDLALQAKPPLEPLTFYMSFVHLADRLGMHPMQAQRIMRGLEGIGLLKLLKKGTRREPGITAKAGIYLWQLKLQPSSDQKR